MSKLIFIAPLLAVTLVACQTTRQAPEASRSALRDSLQPATAKSVPPAAPLPQQLQQELTGNNLLGGLAAPVAAERRFNVAAHDVDAKVFFASLVEGTPLSVAVHPNVSGTISLSLKGVTLSEVLKVVQDIYGYEISRDGKVLRVYPAGMRTETFPMNYLDMERVGLSLTSVSSGRISDSNNNNNNRNSNNNNMFGSNGNSSGSNSGNNNGGYNNNQNNTSNGTFISSKTKTDFWAQLQKTLEAIIGKSGDGRSVVVSPQAGLVTVRAYPDELRQIHNFLKQSEDHLQRQVILEAKILEVRLSDGYQQGIQWQDVLGSALAHGNTQVRFNTSPGQIGNTISQSLGGVTSLALTGSDFSALISLLDTQGDVDVLSSPRVTASNNQKAVIKVGTDEYYVTNVSSTTVASSATSTTTPDVQLTPFFSGIALDVTPQIDDVGNVLLHVHPSVTNVQDQQKSIQVGADTIDVPLAQSEIRESDTVIRARSGDVVVIGGLMKSDTSEQVSKVPLLGDVPLLGQLFTNKVKAVQKTELVILLKPTVVEGDTWTQELKRSQSLLDRWYPQSN
ncbi:pilus (MSHA type) biogenesis protein MshL [Shewanella fodinae]|uniref:MSHA biogenesis protein MshL n=1 Tax=Shewanella fodinae TaxID=552357 RepID=A0A4V2RSM5_9GAMM|nr:pilus (MSHA type) biogenesis protein MshL [Shewanella fodinae]MCL2907366.1 pilus (MSHA type) biogenesis protein MshL [Shewanella fodinae]TCN86287.1 MSHA biogenesis protein MshL [Shewanella fodinae]GGY94069.1 pilus (MSHA type) biogenesis protein MshL [Shewanella fodinae]